MSNARLVKVMKSIVVFLDERENHKGFVFDLLLVLRAKFEFAVEAAET